jgi:hypothetical protein
MELFHPQAGQTASRALKPSSLTSYPEGSSMKSSHLTLIALTAGITFSLAAQAQTLTKAEYKAEKDKISATYKTERAACNSDKGNVKDICVAQAKGKERVDKANLEERYQPTEKTRYKARMAKADADYAVAKERCDDQPSAAKEKCVAEAKTAHTKAKEEANALKK